MVFGQDSHLNQLTDLLVLGWQAETANANGFRFFPPLTRTKYVIRVKYAMFTSGDLDEDSVGCHAEVSARIGVWAHGLVVYRMGWLFGV